MKIKRLLSGTMAGVMAVSSSLVMQLPASAETISATIFESRKTQSWESIDVNLLEYGKMDSGTSVKITAKVAELDIKSENEETGEEETPEWVFGVVINNDWNHDTMPHCYYDSTKTEFSLTLTAEQLSNNPMFTIQQQLPCECEITVEAIDLQEDSRAELSLPAIDKAVTLYTFRGSDWLVGAACGGSYVFQQSALSGVTYGETTVGDFRKNVKSIKTAGNPYYSDSLGIGAENFFYNLDIEMVDENGDFHYVDSSFNQIDFTEDGTTFIDNIFSDDSMDSLKINNIRLYICSKYRWDGDLNKNITINETVRNLLPDSRVIIEPEKDSRSDLTLDSVTAKSVTVTMNVDEQGNKDLQGFVNLPTGELSGITLSEFIKKYHCISIAAPGYFSDSAGVGVDDLVYNIQLEFHNEDKSDGRWLDNSYTELTDTCSLYTTIYEDRLEGAEDFTIDSIDVRVTPKMEELDDGTKQIANETLRNMNDGDSFVLEFVEDTRPDVPVDVSTSRISLGVWDDDDGGWLDGVAASAWSEPLTISGIEYGVTDLKDFVSNNKSVSTTLPYFADSVGAGREAFEYQFLFVLGDNSEIYCDTSVTIGDKLTQLTEDIDLNGYSNTIVKEAYINVNAKRELLENGKMQTVSEKIRALKTGSNIILELVKDERESVQLEAPTAPVRVNVWKNDNDSWTVGNDFSGTTDTFVIPCVEYGKTTLEELRKSVKSLSVTLPYHFDSVGAGKEAFRYGFVIEFSDGSCLYCEQSASVGEKLTQYIDTIDASDFSETVIGKIYLNIFPETEKISEDHVQAASEVIRSLEDGSSFIYEPVEDTRKNITADISTGSVLQLEAHEEPEWFDGIIAYVEFESDKLNGLTVNELISGYRSITVGAPEFVSDSLGLGKDGYGYEVGFRFVRDGYDDQYYFADGKAAFDKDSTLYTTLIDFDLDGYKVDGILVKYWALTEEGESGKPRSASELVRSLESGTIITIVCETEAPAVTAKAGNGQVALNWTKPEYADEFRIYSYADGKFTLLKTTTDTSYTISGLTNGTKYGFAVAAKIFSTWGEPDSSTLVYATPTAPAITKPTNVKAVVSDGQVKLTWNAVERATSYRVYRADSATGAKTQLKIVGTTSCTDTTVTAGKTYYYFVAAYDSKTGRLSAYSEAKSVKVQAAIAAPVITSATSDGKSVSIKWNAVTDTTSYRIYRADSATGAKTLVKTVGTLYGTDTNVTAGKTYYYFVAAYDSKTGRLSAYSEAKSIKVQAAIAAPVITSATSDGKSVSIKWNAVTDATSYHIYRADSATGAKTLVKTVGTTSCTDTTVTAGKTYYYFVAAYDSKTGRLSAYSEAKSVKVQAAIAAPVITSATSDGKSVSIKWNAVTAATSYRVYRADSATGAKTQLKTVGTTSCTDTTVTSGKTYYYFVAAYDSKTGRLSAYSEAKSVKVQAVIAAPVITSATSNGTSVSLKWNAVTDATSYRIYRADSATGTKTQLKTVGTLYGTDTNVTAGKTYYYFVAAYDSKTGRLSAYSEAKSVKVQAAIAAPVITSATSDGKSVSLKWNAVTDATSYRIYRADSTTGAKALVKTVGTLYGTDTNVTAGKTYYYFVAAYDSKTGRLSAYSEAKSVKVQAAIAAPVITKITSNDTSVRIEWEAVAGATSYRVYRADSKAGAKDLIKTVGTLYCTDTTATAGKTYYYFVAAYDSKTGRLSAYSEVESITV